MAIPGRLGNCRVDVASVHRDASPTSFVPGHEHYEWIAIRGEGAPVGWRALTVNSTCRCEFMPPRGSSGWKNAMPPQRLAGRLQAESGTAGGTVCAEVNEMPALGISLILVAVGAILAYAVDATAQGVNIDTVGVILMVVGGIGILASLLFLMSFSPFGSHDDRHAVR